MQTEGRRRSTSFEDRGASQAGGGFGSGGSGGGNPLLLFLMAGRLIRSRSGRILLLILVGGYLLVRFFAPGVPLQEPVGAPPAQPHQVNGPARGGSFEHFQSGQRFDLANESQLKDFMLVVLAETEDIWTQKFEQMGRVYEKPTLVFFSQGVRSGCGQASAAVGPFYCSLDHKIYLDVSFFKELRQRFGASGDFAAAYVLAHEVGHHVQNLLGIHEAYQRAIQGGGNANRLSVRLELQADYLAGVWAHVADQNHLLDPGDIQEALKAAQAIGDDRIQRQATGQVRPDRFTHGTSEQRYRWFKRGYETGDLSQGNTFEIPDSALRWESRSFGRLVPCAA